MERRPLTEGIKSPPPIDAGKEQQFVYGSKETPTSNGTTLGRVPISTRIRGDFAAALKRASLERQLKAVEPNTLQDILEEAIGPWLKSNGYLA